MKSRWSVIVGIVAGVVIALTVARGLRGVSALGQGIEPPDARKAERIRSYYVTFDCDGGCGDEIVLIPSVEGVSGFILTDVAVMRSEGDIPEMFELLQGGQPVFAGLIGGEQFRNSVPQANTGVSTLRSGLPLRRGATLSIRGALGSSLSSKHLVTLSGYVY